MLESLYSTHKLGIISDTWPSIEMQLKTIGVYDYFSTYTYSFEYGVFKPDSQLYMDALMKCGCRAEQAVFIDDSLQNLDGAAELGITPIWINSRHETAVDMKYTTIQSLSELIG